MGTVPVLQSWKNDSYRTVPVPVTNSLHFISSIKFFAHEEQSKQKLLIRKGHEIRTSFCQ